MIDFSHYQARRQMVYDRIIDNSMVLLSAASIQYRNSDTEYPYRQDSFFYYLTGINESGVVAIILKREGKMRYILFCQDHDETIERWTGPRMGVQGAVGVYRADEAYPINEIDSRLPELLVGSSTIYYLVNAQPTFDKKLFDWIETLRHKTRSGVQCPFHFIDLRVLLGEMRLIKRPEEVKLLEKACDISTKAHIRAMEHCRAGMVEYELEAVLLNEFYRQGSRYPAYSSIVAGGKNACILHYVKNNAPLEANSLVLIDAGAEYDHYAADITRTFPVNGKFSKEQQAFYELVLNAQETAIDLIRPGIDWDAIQKQILKVLVSGLIKLNVLKGDHEMLIEKKAYLPFYMHNSGHWLGMDVHDVGGYKEDHKCRKLIPGMVLTVEPGLYLCDKKIGIRIEDDILVTEEGCKILTSAVPKTVSDIEKLMKK